MSNLKEGILNFLCDKNPTSNSELKKFKWRNALVIIKNMIEYLVKMVSGLIVAYEYYQSGDFFYSVLTAAFILYPSLIISVWSIIHLFARQSETYVATTNQSIEDDQNEPEVPNRIDYEEGTTVRTNQPSTNLGSEASSHSGLHNFSKYCTLTFGLKCLCHVFLISPFAPYFEALFLGLRSMIHTPSTCSTNCKCADNINWKQKKTDAETLIKFESIMACGPQLILQLYIETKFISNPSEEPQFIRARIVQIIFSTVSLAHALTKAYAMFQEKMSHMGTVTLFLSNIFGILTRVIAFSLFASSSYGHFIWAVYLGHSLFMANWLGVIQTVAPQSTYENRIDDFFSLVILPFVHIFTYFNIKSEQSRTTCIVNSSYIFFYTAVFAENCALIYLWRSEFVVDPHWFANVAMYLHFAIFPLSIALQSVYIFMIERNNLHCCSRQVDENATQQDLTPTAAVQCPHECAVHS